MAVPSNAQTQIDWFSAQNDTNVTSDEVSLMDGGFHVELGVFSTGFIPTQESMSQRAQNWHPAQRTKYQADIKRYTDSLIIPDNTAPLTVNEPAYVWGFRGDPSQGKWILFRANSRA
jgi:hypothetical protein